ncbi:TetR/AcrR family transcriptional regulator [Phenylobacterium sp.]|uniref:TetR/AcrR family transcriptional regulator n=1 Tax=Phenylobacterium sp. TaxID=1871053 RepID=UPI0035B10FAB
MSRARFENLDAERQQRLFDSAAEEFGERGYDGASLNRILTRSRMSKSSLYYYFNDKADLFTTLVERSIAFLLKDIGGFDPQALTAETYWSELEALGRRAVAVMNGDAWYIKLGRMFYRVRGESKGGGPTDRVFQAGARWVAKVIARGQELGVVRTDLPLSLLADSVMGLGEAMDRWAVAHWDEMDEDARLRITFDMIDLARRLVAP